MAQVAQELAVGEGTVKRYLSEALARLGARLSPAENGHKQGTGSDAS